MLRVSFWDSESVGRLSFGARLLFQCAWNYCDDEGYIKWNPGYLRGCAFRFDDHITMSDVKKFMAEIEAEGMVRSYVPKGEVNTYGECPNFLKYQTINHPSKSKLPKPEPDDYSCSPTVDVPEGSFPNDVKLRQRKIKKTTYTDDFEKFWNAYPNRKAKLAAFKAWQKIDPSLHETIMEKLVLHCKSQAWLKDGGQFVPHASTWLTQERWEDEINDDLQRPENSNGQNRKSSRQFEQAESGKFDDDFTD
jgi:hypothetical protein